MRNQSRLLHLLLLRTHHKIPNQSQLLRSFSSIPLRFTANQSKFPINPNFRNFSSKPVLTNVEADHSVIVDIFSRSRNFDEVKNQLDSNRLSISHYAVNPILRKLCSDPDSARIFFQWVLENYPEKLSSESYNQVLGDLGINGAVEEFWDLVGVMKKKGFGDDAEKEIRDLNVGFSSKLVKLVLETLGSKPNKAMIFFKWVEEIGVFKHDVSTCNAMARVLERKYSIDRYWKLFFEDDGVMLQQEMEEETFEDDGVMLKQDMEEETFVNVLQNDENAKIGVKKQKENETRSTERIHIMESDMTISKLKLLLKEKEQCILQHKGREEKFKRRILHDHYMKQGQSTLLKCLRKELFNISDILKAVIDVLETKFQDKCQKQEKHFAEIEERCRKILARGNEESTRQQLKMYIQQVHIELLKRLIETRIAVMKDFEWAIQAWKDVWEAFDEVLENNKNAKIEVKKQKENETMSVERIQIMESDMTISKLKQLLEEKEQCILQHKEQENEFKCRILHDHYMKLGQSTLLKRLRKKIFNMSENLEAVILVMVSDFQDKCQKQEKHFAETEERCRKIFADCSEESTRQQLMMHIQQGHSEQLKHLRETTIAVWKDFDWAIQVWKDVGETFAKVLQNDKNAKIEVKKQKENETTSVERIQIMESDMTISKLKQLLEEKEQCILQHKEQEKKFKCRILHDHYMKQGQSTLLKRLRKKIFNMSQNFEAVIEGLESDFQDKCQKQEKHFAETEERCRKILADCSEESTRQQLMMHIQQGHSEQLNHLRETTIAVWKDFDRLIQVWKPFLYEAYDVTLEQEMEELTGDYFEISPDSANYYERSSDSD